MKKYIYMMMIACAALFASCNDDSHGRGEGSSENVDLANLTAEGRIGQVVLKWQNPTNPDYYYSMVSYVNAAGETVRQKVSVYSEDKDKGTGYTSAKILGFEDTNNYEFSVTPYTSYGVAGKTETVSCKPEDAQFAYKYIPETVTVEGAVEGAIVKWVNEYEIPVTVKISFKNLLGETVVKEVTGDSDGNLAIGAFVDPTEVTVTASNKAGTATSEPVTVTATPTKGEIPRVNYSIPEYTGGILGAGMDITKLIDGNWQTTWHSSTSAAGDVYFVVDLSTVYQVAMVEFVRRTDDPGASGYPELITVYTSTDNVNYTKVGTHEFDASLVFNHVVSFEPVKARFIKVNMSHGGNWTHLAEFVAYSHKDAPTRYAEQAAAELVPDPDDDDTYYPDTEYMSPETKFVNNIEFEQTNPDNPSEWTFKTTGGDSWCGMKPFENDAQGPVLVFHYKCDANINLECFWCPGGWGKVGPAGGHSTAFGIGKTDTWKTKKMDFTSAWGSEVASYGGYKFGKAKDMFRFDVGDGAGVTLTVRLMHFRAAD
ncbi:MAG: discoidin domain-containing protein [Candidatus Cryptobacteroides sp.]